MLIHQSWYISFIQITNVFLRIVLYYFKDIFILLAFFCMDPSKQICFNGSVSFVTVFVEETQIGFPLESFHNFLAHIHESSYPGVVFTKHSNLWAKSVSDLRSSLSQDFASHSYSQTKSQLRENFVLLDWVE